MSSMLTLDSSSHHGPGASVPVAARSVASVKRSVATATADRPGNGPSSGKAAGLTCSCRLSP
eukprot:8770489-Lingulodinium_polyedra.AAC.1